MMDCRRYIDADAKVHAQVYDGQSETWRVEEVTVADALDAYSDEGCPAPADVEKVRHGRWIWTGAGKENPPYCSECEREAKWCEDYGFLTEDYCPYCGARMDGKE